MKKILIALGLILLLTVGLYYVLKQNKIVIHEPFLFEEFTEKSFPQAVFKELENSILLLGEVTLQGEDQIVHTITLSDDAIESAKLVPNIQKFITDLDVNFDGYSDLGVLVSTGYAGVNNFYDFYIYDEIDNRLIKNKDLVNISNPTIDILARINQVVISTYRSGPMWYSDLYLYGYGDEDTYIKELAIDPNPNMDFQYYAYKPTKTIPEMPLKEIFETIIQDNILDISINNETQSKDDVWYINILEKDRNKDKNWRIDSGVYLDDVLSFSLVTKENWEQIIENAKEDVFDLGNMELRQQNIYSTTWNYYDFADEYDGGYIRTYFIEKDGYVLSFGISNEGIEEYPNLLEMKKIKFLENLNLLLL